MTIAYHFTADTLRDGRPIPPIGETLVHEGPVEICCSGLHASEHPLDAAKYAPGPMLHKVRCEEIEAAQDDKLVCRKRTILATIDARHLLRRFAADQALSVAHLWDMPDVVRDYLTTLDDSKGAAARAAALDAARAAARAAAAAAARDAAAAWGAATDAAWDAAWDAALDAAKQDFANRVAAAFAETAE